MAPSGLTPLVGGVVVYCLVYICLYMYIYINKGLTSYPRETGTHHTAKRAGALGIDDYEGPRRERGRGQNVGHCSPVALHRSFIYTNDYFSNLSSTARQRGPRIWVELFLASGWGRDMGSQFQKARDLGDRRQIVLHTGDEKAKVRRPGGVNNTAS